MSPMRRVTWSDVVVHERIGEGGIADVFRAAWAGREVALKVLRDVDRVGLKSRFLREGRLLQRLEHPGLAGCHAVIDDEAPAILLELLRGEPLDVRVARAPLTGDEGVLVASSLLRTLGYLHERGVVHRDVKTSNVYMVDDRRVVLLDLGLAVEPGDPSVTTLGDIVGTHAYMAPEQIAGAETDHRADLYGLAVTLYEALCGERPFYARGLAGFLEAHRAGNSVPLIERVPGVPVRLAALIDRMMARDPAARPASAAAALALLTGTVGTRRGLEMPPLVGRSAAIGAIQSVIDAGGTLRVRAEVGAGAGVIARSARSAARAEQVEQATLRCRPNADVAACRAMLARELDAMIAPVAPTDEAIRAALGRLAAEGGRFLLVVEDLDSAPEGVSAWVRALAGVPGLALVVTGLGWETDGWPGRTIELRALQLSETRELVAGMLGTPSPPPGLDARIHAASSGLPALAVALMRELYERGVVWCEGLGEDGGLAWAFDPTAGVEPGDDVSRAFGRALATLPGAARALVETAAVAGEPLPLGVLLRAAGVDASGIDLGPARRIGALDVRVDGEEWVTLRRAVLEPIVVGALPRERRRTIHAALARAAGEREIGEWERRFLTVHAARGAESPEHTQALLDLGEWLATTNRAAEALAVLDVASTLPLAGGRALARLALARGEALCSLARLPEARAAIDAGTVLAREAESPADRAGGDSAESAPLGAVGRRARLALAELHFTAGAMLSVDLAADVVQLAGHEDVRGLLLAANLRYRLGDLAAAAADAERCAVLAADNERLEVGARLLAARVALTLGDTGRAVDRLRALVAELRGRHRHFVAAEALGWLAHALLAAGRLGAALEAATAAIDVSRVNALPWRFAFAEIRWAEIHIACGDLDTADAVLRRHAASGERGVPWFVRRAWLEAACALRDAHGDTPSALAAHLRAHRAGRAAGDHLVEAFHGGMSAILTAEVDGVANAAERLQSIGAHRALARLFLLGAVVGRDADLLDAAETEARASGDPLLYAAILGRRGGPGDGELRDELLAAAASGVYGPLRAALLSGLTGRRGAARRDRQA